MYGYRQHMRLPYTSSAIAGYYHCTGSEREESDPPFQLHGTSTATSALLRVKGLVHVMGKTDVPVQPMIDSGATGMGFIDPTYAAECGCQVQPSTRRITLADGSEVQATGVVTITYSLDARVCGQKRDALPVQFTSTFVVTPLVPHQLILGMGWLERHHAIIGFGERSIQLRVEGKGKQHCIRPIARCNVDGSAATEAAPLQLKSITQRVLHKMVKQGNVRENVHGTYT